MIVRSCISILNFFPNRPYEENITVVEITCLIGTYLYLFFSKMLLTCKFLIVAQISINHTKVCVKNPRQFVVKSIIQLMAKIENQLHIKTKHNEFPFNHFPLIILSNNHFVLFFQTLFCYYFNYLTKHKFSAKCHNI